MQKSEGIAHDYGTNCKDCERYKILGDVCVIEHGKKFLWEYCRDFVPRVVLPDYNELMRTVKQEQALERQKVRERKERERRKKLKERMERLELKRKKRRARLRKIRERKRLLEQKKQGKLLKKRQASKPEKASKPATPKVMKKKPGRMESKESRAGSPPENRTNVE